MNNEIINVNGEHNREKNYHQEVRRKVIE